MQAEKESDVAVVGGGLVGLSLAALLGRAGIQVALLEANEPARDWPEDSIDLRVYAITRASQRLFTEVGAWEGKMKKTSILAVLAALAPISVLADEVDLDAMRANVEKYKDKVQHYMKKHLVKAGLTGWAQVHGWRGNTCLHTRIEHDLYYIENWSLWLDIKIIIMTVFRGLVHKNAY
mgnify:CR=1 FL=1